MVGGLRCPLNLASMWFVDVDDVLVCRGVACRAWEYVGCLPSRAWCYLVLAANLALEERAISMLAVVLACRGFKFEIFDVLQV